MNKQVIYAIERSIIYLDNYSDELARQGDYSAEFPYGDARLLEEALYLLSTPWYRRLGRHGSSRWTKLVIRYDRLRHAAARSQDSCPF